MPPAVCRSPTSRWSPTSPPSRRTGPADPTRRASTLVLRWRVTKPGRPQNGRPGLLRRRRPAVALARREHAALAARHHALTVVPLRLPFHEVAHELEAGLLLCGLGVPEVGLATLERRSDPDLSRVVRRLEDEKRHRAGRPLCVLELLFELVDGDTFLQPRASHRSKHLRHLDNCDRAVAEGQYGAASGESQVRKRCA